MPLPIDKIPFSLATNKRLDLDRKPAGKGGDRAYALLRESMREAGVIGKTRIVMRTREHLAVLVPSGAVLVLNTIRLASYICPVSRLKLPADGKIAPTLKPGKPPASGRV